MTCIQQGADHLCVIRQTFFDATDQQAGFFAVILLAPGQGRQRPRYVFGHHGFGLVLCQLQRGYDVRGGRAVAESHRQVAAPALIADTPDRAPLSVLEKLALAPAPQFEQRRAVQVGARAEVGLGAHIRIAIPGADELAVVTTIDAIAH